VGGFSLDASVRIEASDRHGRERLLRYCARPAFALERLREIDAERLVYESVKPGAGGSVSLMLTPLDLIERLAALIPPPRRHRHRCCGVPAPNAPLCSAVTRRQAAEPPEAAIRWSGARWLLWVGCRLLLRPDEGQLQLSKPTLTVPLPASLSALPKRSQGPRQVFRLTESLWRIKIEHDSLVRVR